MSEPQSDRNTDQGAPGQDDPEALVEDINRTRAELGDTVEALVAKVDVKARAQQRAAEASTQAKAKLQALQTQLAGRASGTAKRMTSTVDQTRQAAAANGKTVLGAGASGGKTVQRRAQQAVRTVGQHQIPFAVAATAAAAVLAGWLVVRRRRR